MAKFLPFVVEKSTPIYIYQTIITRSKGINSILVASIFYLIMDKGIDKVRETADLLPDMPLDKLYENLINTYAGNRISNEYFHKIQAIAKYVYADSFDDISKELKEYTIADIMSFLLVMLIIDKLSDWTSLPLENLFNEKASEAEQNLTKYKLFSSDGVEVVFQNKEDLAAYINFYTVIYSPKMIPIKAVLISTEGTTTPEQKSSGKASDYTAPSPDPRGVPPGRPT